MNDHCDFENFDYVIINTTTISLTLMYKFHYSFSTCQLVKNFNLQWSVKCDDNLEIASQNRTVIYYNKLEKFFHRL